MFAFEYKRRNDIIIKHIVAEENLILSRFKNFGSANEFGINFSFSMRISNSIEIEGSSKTTHHDFPDNSDHNGWGYYAYLSGYADLPLGIVIEAEVAFAAREINYNGYLISNTIIEDISVYKYILDDNGTIGFSIVEPLLTSQDREKTWTQSYSEENQIEYVNKRVIF